jgi:hypothetical protein
VHDAPGSVTGQHHAVGRLAAISRIAAGAFGDHAALRALHGLLAFALREQHLDHGQVVALVRRPVLPGLVDDADALRLAAAHEGQPVL